MPLRLTRPLLMILASAAGFAATIDTASATERWRYDFNKREARQLALIYEGRRTGAITGREAIRLSMGIQNIARKRKIFARDGIDAAEADEIRQAQDQLSELIFELRDNAERARPGSGD